MDAVRDWSRYSLIRTLSSGRERVDLMKISLGSEEKQVVVKTYPKLGVVKRFFAKRTGSKASRAFQAATILRENGVETPRVLALGKDQETGKEYLVTEFVTDLTDFRQEMNRLLVGDGVEDPSTEISTLLQVVATACRTFHDCGIIHRDLGNQNIGLKKGADGKWQVVFLDLDRVRIFPAGTLSWNQRGHDLARISLPSELKTFFLFFYTDDMFVEDLFSAERKERRAFVRHEKMRPWRHPIREWKLRQRCKDAKGAFVPMGKELWLWDAKTDQAIPASSSKERRAYRPIRNLGVILKSFLCNGRKIWREFQRLNMQPFLESVDFSKTFGVGLEADPTIWEMQLYWLKELESGKTKLPVLLRAYHHKGREQWTYLCKKANELFLRGNSVSIALVQDRAAVRNPESWREMVISVVEKTHAMVDFYEVGHATNRGKWGIWDFRDYTEKLLPIVLDAKARFPQIKLTGPACIDFDLHTLIGILGDVPKGTFHALSQHLYVDRRGAPENFQGKFDTVGKCAIHRAIARVFGFKEEKIIVSEFNWPLLGTGTWSPVGAFYCARNGPFQSPPSVSEDEMAQFSVRYWLLSIASGHVSRVYWWRLVHHGYGLVDNLDMDNPRPRPAFGALKNMIELLIGARFVSCKKTKEDRYELGFSRATGEKFTVEWTKATLPIFGGRGSE